MQRVKIYGLFLQTNRIAKNDFNDVADKKSHKIEKKIAFFFAE